MDEPMDEPTETISMLAQIKEVESLRNDVLVLQHKLNTQQLEFLRLETKLNSKPGFAAMLLGILIMMFGTVSTIASTIAVLQMLGFMK